MPCQITPLKSLNSWHSGLALQAYNTRSRLAPVSWTLRPLNPRSMIVFCTFAGALILARKCLTMQSNKSFLKPRSSSGGIKGTMGKAELLLRCRLSQGLVSRSLLASVPNSGWEVNFSTSACKALNRLAMPKARCQYQQQAE